MRGVGNVAPRGPRGPPGPPPPRGPMGAPMAQMKPPPMQPPRGAGVNQRPPIETIKVIEPMNKPGPRGVAKVSPPTSAGGPRGAPPRGTAQGAEEIGQPDEDETLGGGVIPMYGMAAPKFSAAEKPQAAPKKAGAIAMFTPAAEEPTLEPADKKMRLDEAPKGRTPRPLAPRAQAPGIPSGQPLPPGQGPDKDSKPPAPMRPAPNRNRAPPRADDLIKVDKNGRPKEAIVAPDAPSDQPPFLRGVKPPVPEEPLPPRRQRENPEFESSSSEEEEEVKEKHHSKDPFAHIKPRVDDGGFVAPEHVQQPSVAAKKAQEEKEAALLAEAEKKQKKLASASNKDIKMIGDEEYEDMEDNTGIVDTGAVSVAETFDTKSDAGDSFMQQAPIGIPPSNVADNVVSSYVPPAPQDFVPVNVDSTLGRDLLPGRFSVRCLSGDNIRRKDDTSSNPRTDPYIKFKLGAAERFPWVNSAVVRKQDNFPDFNEEVIIFNMTNPGQYVFLDDVQLTVEVWNKSAFKDELMGAVTMSVVRILKSSSLKKVYRCFFLDLKLVVVH